MKERFVKIGHWMMDRLMRIPERDHYIGAWLLGFFVATTISVTIHAVGNPIGASFFSHAINIGKLIAINGLLFLVSTFVLGALFSFIYLPLPRIWLAGFSYTAFSSVTILINASSGTLFSFIVGIGYSFVAIFLGLLFLVLFHKKIGMTFKISILAVILVLSSSYLLFDQLENNKEAIPAIAEQTDPVIDENPANKGDYNYTFFTYGTGRDLHRNEFGENVDEITSTVDASHFVKKWDKDREKFWGFNSSDLPINGRAWLPDGEGSFPVILMVHGNHTMEYFSTSGYDYLGELLASRGFIAISVDEDFINYSNTFGSPKNNYQLRAWMLLQHLAHLQQMNDSPENIFYQKIDFEQVGLMGHSRGGQAALMAADYPTFFEDDDILSSMETINIKGVVAIAPTDKVIDDKRPAIHNTSYLLLHGARDADVSDYRNDKQFYRATFDPEYDGFKATVYISDANHTQFNTGWGSEDLSLPRGIFLNKAQTMDPTDQQQIAKVYMSAFFESVFRGHAVYEQLFQDYQYGKEWLPDTTLVSKYRHATYEPIETFNSNQEKAVDTSGFIKSDIVTPKHRRDHDRLRDALQLEWEEDASYTFDVSGMDLQTSERIVLTMANINDEAENESVPEIEIELETTNGTTVRLPLDDFMPFPPVIKTDYTHFGLFDNIFRGGRYNNSWEPIFQTFEIPIETFTETFPEFAKDQVNKVTMHFTSLEGKILIEEIGVY